MVKSNRLINLISEMKKSEIYAEYIKAESFIHREHYLNADGIHGIYHTKRVLILSLCLSHIFSHCTYTRNILINASLYHDIGRTHDFADRSHGIKSYRKLRKILPRFLDYDNEPIKFLIENHCLEIEYIDFNKYKLENPEKIKQMLHIFKDADALDRVRLDTPFEQLILYNNESVELFEIAKYLYHLKENIIDFWRG